MKKLLLLLIIPLLAFSQNTGICTVGDCTNGQGTFVWDDGDRYEGDWESDMMNGEGTFYFDNGKRYEGSFINNKFHGQGIYTWPSGDKYEGGFSDDKFHGQGTFMWADGETYVGGWKDDVKNGTGIASNDIRIDKGTWKDNKRHGLIERYTPNGKKVYEIEYVNGEIIGYIRVYNENGEVLMEDFVKEELELDNKVYSDGQLTMCTDDALYFSFRPTSLEASYLSEIQLGPWELDGVELSGFCTERVFVETREPVTGLVYETYSNGNNKYTMAYKNGKYNKQYFQYNNFNGTKRCLIKGKVTKNKKKVTTIY